MRKVVCPIRSDGICQSNCLPDHLQCQEPRKASRRASLSQKRLAEIEQDSVVSVAHARKLIEVYDAESVVDRPWYYSWAQTIDRLATALECAGLPTHIVEAIATNQPPVPPV